MGSGLKRKSRTSSSTLAFLECTLRFVWTVNANSYVDFSLIFLGQQLMPLRYYVIVAQTAITSRIHSEVEILEWTDAMEDFEWVFGKMKRRWILWLPNELAEQLNGPCLLLVLFCVGFCVSGIVIFELGYFPMRLCRNKVVRTAT